MATSGDDKTNLNRIFDVDRLGIATYFLSLGYLCLAVFASYKFSRIRRFVLQWNAEKLFHTFVVVHVYVRAIAFGALCWLSLVGGKPWYPLLVMLFTLPEIFIMSTYVLLFFHWLEISIFSHQQFIFLSKITFRRNWRWAFAVISVGLYGLLAAFYLLLTIKPTQFEESTCVAIQYSTASGNLAMPAGFLMAGVYFEFFLLSGFPFISVLASERVSKVSRVLVVWSLGRVVRGVLLIVSIQHQWVQHLDGTYYSMFVVSGLVLAEFIPLALALDWNFVGNLFLLEETQPFTVSASDGNGSYGGLDQEESVRAVSKHEMAITDLKLGEILHDEEFAFSQKASYRGDSVILKGFRLQELNPHMINELTNDIVDLSSIDHDHLVPFVGVAKSARILYAVSKFMTRGSLYDVLRQATKNFSPFQVIRISREMALALQHLHSHNQVHGSFKSRNALLDGNMSIKVGDFGLRRIKAYLEVMLVRRMATVWSAPEVIQGHPVTQMSDVYSYGIVCWELLTRKIPFDGRTLSEVAHSIVNSNAHPPIPSATSCGLPDRFTEMIASCWLPPAQRPSFDLILAILADCEKELEHQWDLK